MLKAVLAFLRKLELHELFFLFLIILLPVQLGKHWWPDWSYVLGLRIDYLSPTFYLTDLLVLGVLGSWGWERLNKKAKRKDGHHGSYFFSFSVFLFLLINVFLAQNQGAAFYKLIKIIELGFLGFYVAKNHYSSVVISQFLPVTIIYGSLIAIAQFFKQASLGGAFYWFGERTFSIGTPGIAKTVLGGQLFLRPYGTFPHPNVLAGFTLTALILLNEGEKKRRLEKVLGYTAFVLGLTTIILSFSRSAWWIGLLAAVVLNFGYLKRIKAEKNLWFYSGLGWLLIGGFFLSFSSWLPLKETISQRVELNKASFLMVKNYPLRGVGLNNFIVRLPEFWQALGTVRFLQPVHNIFLLIAAETGLVGLLVFFWFLVLIFKKIWGNLKFVILILAVLGIGMVDHYWLTLQQTQLLLAISLGLSWKEGKI